MKQSFFAPTEEVQYNIMFATLPEMVVELKSFEWFWTRDTSNSNYAFWAINIRIREKSL